MELATANQASVQSEDPPHLARLCLSPYSLGFIRLNRRRVMEMGEAANNLDGQAAETLAPRHKILAIGVVNFVLLGFYWVVLKWGYEDKRPPWDTRFAWSCGGTIAICAFLVLKPELGGLLKSLGGKSSGTDSSKVLDDNSYIGSLIVRYGITVMSYINASLMVLGTGGIRLSPFEQIPIAMVLLAPVIMTGNGATLKKNSKQQNMLWGLIYVPILFVTSSHSGFRLVRKAAEGVFWNEKGWVSPFSLIFIVIASLAFDYLKNRA